MCEIQSMALFKPVQKGKTYRVIARPRWGLAMTKFLHFVNTAGVVCACGSISIYAVKPLAVFKGNGLRFLYADAPKLCQLFRHAVHPGGIVAPAPEGLR